MLFSSRSSWSATELTDRLEVTPRTLRRDVTRLRDLGYPIESTTGRYGGYALGAGGTPEVATVLSEAEGLAASLTHADGLASHAEFAASLSAKAPAVKRLSWRTAR